MLPREVYENLDEQQLVSRYVAVCIDLVHAHEELAESLVAQLSSEVDAYTYSQANSISGMDREAKIASAHATVEVFKSRGKLAALEAEATLLQFLLKDCHGKA